MADCVSGTVTDVFASFLTYFYVNLSVFFDQSKIYKKFLIFYLCYVQMFDSESLHFGMHAWMAAQAGGGSRSSPETDFSDSVGR